MTIATTANILMPLIVIALSLVAIALSILLRRAQKLNAVILEMNRLLIDQLKDKRD